MALVGALVVDLAVLGTDLFLVNGVAKATKVSFDDVLADFRRDEPPTTGPAALPPGTVAAEVPSSTSPTEPAGPSPTSVAPAPVDAPDLPAPPAAAFEVPDAGVYRYRTSGQESISLLGASHSYPAETYAVVRHEGGCRWRIRSEVVAEHTDERLMCSEPGSLLQLEQTRLVSFFGMSDGGTFACSPPQVQHRVGDAPDTRSVSECTGSGSTAKLTRRTLGEATMTIQGVSVEVVRFRIDGVVTGRVQGSTVDLVTIHARTGLPLVWERTVDNTANAFGAPIRYREQARFELVSLSPTT